MIDVTWVLSLVSLLQLMICRGPLNEDVFAAPGCSELKAFHPEIQTITEQIQQLLLQVKLIHIDECFQVDMQFVSSACVQCFKFY